MESFRKAYARCQKDLDALLHDRLSDLDLVLTRVQHLVIDIERCVTLIENVRSRQERVAKISPAGMHRLAVASSKHSKQIRSAVAALDRVDQEAREVSVRVDTLHMPAPPSA